MVNRNELRIGNKVNSPYHNLLFATVDGMTTGAIVMMKEVSTYDTFEDIEPIPLTHEILEACGFEYYMQDRIFKISNFSIVEKGGIYRFIIDADENYPKEIGKTFNCLHQLQNLYFALTGTELQIDEKIFRKVDEKYSMERAVSNLAKKNVARFI